MIDRCVVFARGQLRFRWLSWQVTQRKRKRQTDREIERKFRTESERKTGKERKVCVRSLAFFEGQREVTSYFLLYFSFSHISFLGWKPLSTNSNSLISGTHQILFNACYPYYLLVLGCQEPATILPRTSALANTRPLGKKTFALPWPSLHMYSSVQYVPQCKCSLRYCTFHISITDEKRNIPWKKCIKY